MRTELTIVNKLGLHARASAKFVTTASSYPCEVWLERCGKRVNGKSIMGVMMLAAAKGTTLTLETVGEQEEACAQALQALVAARFGEEE
ncbi:MAG: HPr family phosphocarrier protein [Pseudomonadota bacterium]|uniref:HPr family phosphocarrier protein n=1 Tax=Thermithiobacillus tepidarius TaxID=929 RepID=UPI000412F424|nr:HPr family phosphocarrier protein [Thermithiobacillus tepidarius]